MNDLRKELHAETERCKNLQNDLTTFIEREGRIAKTLASVSAFEYLQAIFLWIVKTTSSLMNVFSHRNRSRLAKVSSKES